MDNSTQLITYADSLGGGLRGLKDVLRGPFAGLFRGGVHILPPFPSSGDRGFAPKTYYEIDPKFGTWDDIRTIAEDHAVILDIMVNHISRSSDYFLDFAAHGRASAWADLFVTVDKVWPDSKIPVEEAGKIACRKPGGPFTDIAVGDTGAVERVWTTFGSASWSEQIDLDVGAPSTRELFASVLQCFAARGVKGARLDAVGYTIKKRGTDCFFVEPEIFEFLDWFKEKAASLGMELLPELHSLYKDNEALISRGYRTYDFVLPGLLLHSFYSGSSLRLREYLRNRSGRYCTVLDCHDGIPLQPDLTGILSAPEMRRIVETCLARGANLSRLVNGGGAEGLDVHQINITYYEALGKDDESFLAARAVQLFVPGIPQIYYVGLLAGENDQPAVSRTGAGRAVNRHDFSRGEIDASLEKPIVRRLFSLLRFRNTHPSFGGRFSVLDSDDDCLVLEWRNGNNYASLEASLSRRSVLIRHSDAGGKNVEWNP